LGLQSLLGGSHGRGRRAVWLLCCQRAVQSYGWVGQDRSPAGPAGQCACDPTLCWPPASAQGEYGHQAVAITEAFLAKYPDLTGIWAANDNMGLGALEALRTAGKNKTIPTCGIDGTSEAINACISQEFAATVNNDPMWQGGMGLSMAHAAATGVFDPSKEPNTHREFYFEPVAVNAANAQEIKTKYIDGTPHYDWADYWSRVQE
jgi:ABC-type xylose transport system substrate-binding protein